MALPPRRPPTGPVGNTVLRFSVGSLRLEHDIAEGAPLTFILGNAEITFMVTQEGVVLRSSVPFQSVSNKMDEGAEMLLYPAPLEPAR
jgi:hypothetical protein